MTYHSDSNHEEEKASSKHLVRPNVLNSFFYNLAFIVFAIVSLPFFLKRLKQAENSSTLINERLGIFENALTEKLHGKEVIWLHTVSVGEVMASESFVSALLEKRPEAHIIISTVTPTGQKVAKTMESDRVSACYFPFDLTFAIRRSLEAIKPKLVLLLETEIWPNFICEVKRKGIPVGVVNGRLSEKSLRGYKGFSFLFRNIFDSLDFVLAQTDEDAERYSVAGVNEKDVQVFGSMKFDNVDFAESGVDIVKLRKECGFENEDLVLVAGSTHLGEEKSVLKVCKKLVEEYSNLKVVLAPRHIERVSGIEQEISELDFSFQKWSEKKSNSKKQVLLVDEIGILKKIYAIADVVFMGGSLVVHGGQNPIEPAAFKKAVIHGPHVFNFKQVYQVLDEKKAACLVQDEEQFYEVLKNLLADELLRSSLGERAHAFILEMQGATKKHIDHISSCLEPAI